MGCFASSSAAPVHDSPVQRPPVPPVPAPKDPKLVSKEKEIATSQGVPEVPSASAEVRPCRWGQSCHNFDQEHRKSFLHPAESTVEQAVRRACRYGVSCYRREMGHLSNFCHPGDRNYRNGLVKFEAGQKPDFTTLWNLFQYHDFDETGYLSKVEFALVVDNVTHIAPKSSGDADEEWCSSKGEAGGHLNFRQFTKWAENAGVELPLGLEVSEAVAEKKCRFSGKTRCSCPAFTPGQNGLCECGHKESMHRSDSAQKSTTEYFVDVSLPGWTAAAAANLVRVEDTRIITEMQAMFDASHKKTDNWTRDRGCNQHGVGKCEHACASTNRVPVPGKFLVRMVFRNQNVELWRKFSMVKAQISTECRKRVSSPHVFTPAPVVCNRIFDDAVDSTVNEWRLMHGTSFVKADSICKFGFRMHYAGTGATWKEGGQEKGTPLYGFGCYFAERITKADEYSDVAPEGHEGAGLYAVLVCRVVGGYTNIITTNEIEVEKLMSDVFNGPYHSVFGDREISLGKPYREVVVYDKDQVYPEYLVLYERH